MSAAVVLPALAAGVSLAGGVAGAVGRYRAQNAQAKALAQNAKVQRLNAQQVQTEAGIREAVLRRRTRQTLAEQATGVAERGVAMEGSALDLYETSVRAGELDALTERYRGDVQARGLLYDADLRDSEAKTLKSSARSGLILGILGAGAEAAGSYFAMGGKGPKWGGGGPGLAGGYGGAGHQGMTKNLLTGTLGGGV